MANSTGYWMGKRRRHTGMGGRALAIVKRRMFEALGFALLLGCLLLVLMLTTYNPRDSSLDTAVDSAPSNFLGHQGAVLADLLWQSLGLAAFVIPLLLLTWAFRLLLDRPLRAVWMRLGLLPFVLILGALALSVVDLGALSPPAGPGGAVGWALQRLLVRAGLGTAGLPISMAAASLAGLLLMATMGLSLRDWREIGEGAGRGASRLADISGRGSYPARSALGRVLRRWRVRRTDRNTEIDNASRGRQTYREAIVTPLPTRREPRLDHGQNNSAEGGRERGGLVRFIAPKTKPVAQGGRAERERQATLALEPDDQPVLPSLDLLTKPQNGKTEVINEEALEKNARLLETVLEDFGVRGQIVQVRPGPVVTLYELEPAPGIKASRIIGLADDIARSMSAISVRVAVVSGRNVIGIELPNRKAETVFLRELLEFAGLREPFRPPRPDFGQGHLGRAGAGGPGQNAASADRGHYRIRQIGRHQYNDPLHPLSNAAGPLQVHHGRSQDARALRL